MHLSFTKMQACGNDFVVLNDLQQDLKLTPQIIRKLADRRRGIGCDQVLLVTQPLDETTDFGYRIFNADGSEVGQCGNGARCLAHFIHDLQLSSAKTLSLSTLTTQMKVTHLKEQQYQVHMPEPSFDPQDLPMKNKGEAPYTLQLDQQDWSFFIANVGNPHIMIMCDHKNTYPAEDICRRFSQHKYFPEGVNVSFAYLEHPSSLIIDVFERGSGWTAACGSAATACASMAMRYCQANETITVKQQGGDLCIHWPEQSGPVFMSGPSELCFKGDIVL